MSLFRFASDVPPLEQLEVSYASDGGRWYKTPEGNVYPSVTTGLSATADKTKLDEWRLRVGEEEAERTSVEARNSGNALHLAMESVFRGDPPDVPTERVRRLVRCMLPALPQIDQIRHIEAPLYSDELRVAGRTDLIADWDGVLSIIDFKSGRKAKKPEWIKDYFVQATLYAECYKHLTGLEAKQIVVLVAVADILNGDGECPTWRNIPQTFVKNPVQFRVDAKKRIEQFWERHEKRVA